MFKCARWSLVVLLLTAMPAFAQDGKKFTIKSASAEPPKELDASIRKLVDVKSIQFFDPAGTRIADLWFCSKLTAEATPAQLKNGLTYRELKESTIVAVVRFDQPWQDYRKQKIKAGVYTLRLGFQPADGDHAGKSMFAEFLVLNAASRDTTAELLPTKTMIEMSMKSIDTSHPAVFMLFPNAKPAAAPELVSKGNNHWALNIACPAEANGVRSTLGFGLTLVGEADE